MAFVSKLFNRKERNRNISPEFSEVTLEEEPHEDGGSTEEAFYRYKEEKKEHINTEEEEEYEIVEREILPAKIICPDCGGITLEGLEFCDKCGGEL